MRTEIPICIFAKPPAPLDVKTRLIPALGAVGAARLASAMLEDVWRTVEACPGVRPILATTRPGEFPIPVRKADIWLQGEGNLGERIERVVMRGIEQSVSVMAIGADTPAFTATHLRTALECLKSHEAVLGPSIDGGFYLVGLRRCPRGLFSSIPWSTAETCQALRERLRQHDFSVAELEPLFDVDTPADIATLGAYLTTHPSVQSATRAWWIENSCASAS